MIYYRNGKLMEGEGGLDLSQPAFRTGYGFFETICWNGSRICHLDLHLKRAHASLAAFDVIEEAVEYGRSIHEVLEANDLGNSFARVNIFFPVEHGRTSPIITAVPFEYVADREWRLLPSKDVFLSTLMRHKTTNRMSYLNAWQEAVESGFDDALLTDFDGNVLESSFAALLFRKGEAFFAPDTQYKLPSTAQEIAGEHILIQPAEINLADMEKFEHVYALNSLGGMIPVTAVGDFSFSADHLTARRIARTILLVE
ncbi:aminotransferase class IV [Maridesulfovibrio sp. FT414]|uniref:aminotransferase class IV n=1 Tax=Maridesulfovibrio sp. FT414 TaxID=2979469 RepID=UPI003D8005A1